MTPPMVSVLVPTYDRPRLLAETLDSLRAQTMPLDQFEVIIANDGGVTIGDEVLHGLQGRVLNLPANRGLSAALNAALAIATGRYTTVSADDDLVLPAKLRALSAALDTAPPSIAATFGWPVYTDAQGNEKGCPEAVMAFLRTYPVVTHAIAMEAGLLVHGTATLYRTDALRQVGGWNEQMPTAEEWDMNHRLLRFAGDFQAVDVPAVTYRAGGKHAAYKGQRPRHVMNLTYDAIGVPRRDASGKVLT